MMQMKKSLLIIVAIVFILLGGLFVYEKYFNKSYLSPAQPSGDPLQIQTTVSQKPRDKIIEYVVQNGDKIAAIGEMFNISVDTIKWANGLTSDTLTTGQTLKLLPVTGVAHVVVKGDTVESLALKYHTTVQKIIDFPFNEHANPETYLLIPGKTLIIPDGRM